MPKIPECDRCLFYSHHYLLVCAAHPYGPGDDFCPDYTPDPELAGKRFVDFLGLEWTAGEDLINLEDPIDNPFNFDDLDENWAPVGTRFVNGELVMEKEGGFYNGEFIPQPQQRRTPEEQLELLDTHPLFTGRCPNCEMPFPQNYSPPVHWDCPYCDWKDDSV